MARSSKQKPAAAAAEGEAKPAAPATEGEAKPAAPATESALAAAPTAKGKDDGRIARLERKVEALYDLLHDHGIRHKAIEPGTGE